MAIEAPAAIEQPQVDGATNMNEDANPKSASFAARDAALSPSVAPDSNMEVRQEAAPQPAHAREAAASSEKNAVDSEVRIITISIRVSSAEAQLRS